MVTDVSLSYNTNSHGVLSCSGLSVPFANVTVQDIMNEACLSPFKCGQEVNLCYVSKYFEGLGNFLTHVIFDRAHLPESVNYNTSQTYWELSVNGQPANQGMSTAQVQSNDKVQWVFKQNGPQLD